MPDHVVDIAVSVFVNKTFHYRVPDEMKAQLVPGSRVLVPFGSRRISGTVLGFIDAAETTDLKSVVGIIDNALTPDLINLARWMSDYYLYPLGPTIEAVVPKAVLRAKPIKKTFLRVLKVPPRPLRGKKQAALVSLLIERGEVDADSIPEFSRAPVNKLREAGIIEVTERDTPVSTDQASFTPDSPPSLMPEQAEAVDRISEPITTGLFAVFLLHGVTGSGKTEVYLRTIGRLAGTGRGAIVLVPEIALTPQLLSRFRLRFGNRVAVLHSGLTERERVDEYRRIQAGQVDVAIGARSAVFAPFKQVGLIIVDEEHESSYKQDEGLRYNARDVAIMRAKYLSGVVVLGSATPSLESYYNAKNGKYRYLRLAYRVDHRPLPQVRTIDVRLLSKDSLYSPGLIADIRERLNKNEQTLLLLNRRGFSSALICRDCGAAVKCPSCSVALTYHKVGETLKCHYCGHLAPVPVTCPRCAGVVFKLLGTGTQKIEIELQTLFPHARLMRMDSDAVKGREAYERLLQRVDRREVDILLGTQMIAKGHDFPAVTLVGVVNADVGLNLPDFRSAEKTFQLITQAAGRAGRGDAVGMVVIQTMNANHYSIRHSTTHDYEGFYNEEMMYRSQLGYPPIGRMIKLEFWSQTDKQASEAAKTAQARIRNLIRGKEVILLGPAPAPISRVRGQYRFQIILLSAKREITRFLAAEGRKVVEDKYGRKCKVIVDVDPVNLM